jgi:3-oxoacyl-[acyl-carrier-protein] synthase III
MGQRRSDPRRGSRGKRPSAAAAPQVESKPVDPGPRALPKTPLAQVALLGIGSTVPERRLTNADLTRLVDTSDEWIRTRTGIQERRILAPGQVTSDLAAEAARRALANSGLAAEQVEAILVATATPDQPVPCTAAFVQEKIGARNAMGCDVDAGCTGFLYALQVGRALIASGAYANVLVIGADALSVITDYQSRETCVLFGDAAGAVVLGRTGGRARITDMQLGLDGRGTAMIDIPAGGALKPTSHETVEKREHYLRMNGREVFRFAVEKLSSLTRELCTRNHLTLEDIELVIPHQANGRILEAAATALELDPARMFSNLENYGNTSAASIPLALDEALQAGRIGKGNHVILAAFGAGLAWGGALLTFE